MVALEAKREKKILSRIQNEIFFKSDFLPVKIPVFCLNLGW
jgi:hypothetical protein